MQIEERARGTVTILDLKGKLTLGGGDTLLKDKVRSLLMQGRRQIVVNLAAVSYLDSAGLGELTSGYATAARDGGQLKLANLTAKIHNLLVITRLLTIFECFDSEEEAVRSFAAPV